MPKPDGFLVDQTSPTSGFMLGDIASTAEGPVTLHYPSGEPFGLPTTCRVVDASNNLLFTVHRAGAEPQPMFSFKPIRKPTIVRDPVGAIIGMLSSDSEKPVTTPPTGYSGYSSRPRFEGQPAKFTVEGVPLYAWFKVWTFAEHCKQVQIYYYAADGSTEKPNAYDHKLHPHMGPPPYPLHVYDEGLRRGRRLWRAGRRAVRGDGRQRHGCRARCPGVVLPAAPRG